MLGEPIEDQAMFFRVAVGHFMTIMKKQAVFEPLLNTGTNWKNTSGQNRDGSRARGASPKRT